MNEDAPIAFPLTGFTIERHPNFPNASITIRKLTILRPLDNEIDEDEEDIIDASIGEIDGYMTCAVQEIEVTPRIEGDREGYVRVSALLEGASGLSAMGHVHGTNRLQVDVRTANITGPIECEMHPLSNSLEEEPSWNSTIRLAGTGNLLGDVTMHSWAGTNPKLGCIESVEFPNGTIGTASNIVDLHADGVIEEVIAKEIHADIAGTRDDPGTPLYDAFVSIVGFVHAKTIDDGTGEFSGRILVEELTMTPLLALRASAHNIVIQGPMNGRIWVQHIEGDGTANDVHGISLPNAIPPLHGTISLGVLDPPNYQWGSPVEVLPSGPARITFLNDDADGYDPPRLASALGGANGGAVGVVPFLPHPDDFNPTFPGFLPLAGPVHPNDPQTDLPITARWYGPVRLPASGRAFNVEARLLTPSAAWFDANSVFPESLNSPANTAVRPSRGHRMPGGYEYRVTPVNTLYCDLPDPSLPDQAVVGFPSAFEFRFQICDVVPFGDADSNGVVNFADISRVLANLNAGGILLLGDADKNDTVNFADVSSVLTFFNFTHCGGATQSAPALAGKRNGAAPAHQDLADDASVPQTAEAAAMLIADALQSMGYASIEAFVAAIEAMDEDARNAEVRELGRLLEGGE